jgi:hypothetical protein
MKTKPKTIIPYSFWAANQNKKNTTTYDNVIACQTSMEEAVFVRRFIWLYESKKQEGQGWVFIVPKTFAERVGMSVYSFRRVVKRWEHLNILETKSKGLPLKKYYHLDEERLAWYLSCLYEKRVTITNLIENDKIGSRKREDKVIENDKILNTSKRSKGNNCCDGDKPHTQRSHKSFSVLGGDKPKDTPEHRLSVQFFQAVQDTVERNFPRNQLPKKDKDTGRRNWTAWDRAFRDFLQEGRFTYEQISSTIKWYASHIGKKCVPELYSAKTFCEEYIRVLKAIKRDKDDQDKRLRQQRRDGTDPTQYPIVEKKDDGWTYYTYSDGSRGRKRDIDKTHSESESLTPAWTIEEEGDDDFDAEAGEPYF